MFAGGGIAASEYISPCCPYCGGRVLLSGEVVKRFSWVVLSSDGPGTDGFSITVANVGNCCYTKVQSASLGMDKFNRFDVGEVCGGFHYKAVSVSLRVYPFVWFKSNVCVNAVEECPRVRGVALVDVGSGLLSGLAEDRPWYSCLELQVIDRYLHHLSDFVILAQVG